MSEEEGDYGDYDINSHDVFYWNELIPVLVFYGITFILGISGNCLIVFTIYKHSRMQSVTNLLLASLAIADLLLITLCVPVKKAFRQVYFYYFQFILFRLVLSVGAIILAPKFMIAKLFSYTWQYGAFNCKFVHYVQHVSIICSVLTLTAISVERYYAIVHPIRAKYMCTTSQAKRVILLTWILSFILAAPIIVVQSLIEVGEKYTLYWCSRDIKNKHLWKYFETYIFILVLVIPFTIMTLAYSLICWEVWNVMERRSVMTSGHALQLQRLNRNGTTRVTTSRSERDDSKMVKQVISMLITVVVLFGVCWGPVLVDNLLTAYEILPHSRTDLPKHLQTVFTLMSYLNSCINPVIYGFMSKNFKESFRSVLCCYRRSRHNGHMTSSIRQSSTFSQTRHTSAR